jgi:hypothetical protein
MGVISAAVCGKAAGIVPAAANRVSKAAVQIEAGRVFIAMFLDFVR